MRNKVRLAVISIGIQGSGDKIDLDAWDNIKKEWVASEYPCTVEKVNSLVSELRVKYPCHKFSWECFDQYCEDDFNEVV